MSSFVKLGQSISFTGATSAPTPVQVTVPNAVISEDMVVSNVGAVTVFIGWGATAAAATANAVIPTGTPSDGYPVLAGAKETLQIPGNYYVTGITGSSTAVVYLTPGIEK